MTELERMDAPRLSNAEANKITRDCLKRAMIRLLNEKDFQKISITELVRVAGVSRTAFYRNYDSKEDLLADISASVRDLLAESILKLNNAESPAEKQRLMTDILLGLQANSRELIWLVNIGRSLLSHEQIESIVAADNERAQFINAACISAIVGVTTRWIKTGMVEPAEQISRLCCDLIRHMREVAA